MDEMKDDALKKCLSAIRVAQRDWDIESAHVDADNALCDFLASLGYEKIVEEYKKVNKWYA